MAKDEAENPLPDDVTGGVDNAFAAPVVANGVGCRLGQRHATVGLRQQHRPPFEVTFAPVNSASIRRLFERDKRIGSW